jgi:hypothetical protein
MGTGRGRYHGTSSSEPFDRWFRYPAGFASDYAALLLQHLNLHPGSLIIDPFAGSAVTGTASRTAGMQFFGIEAHPLISELARIKLQRPPGVMNQLTDRASQIVVAAQQGRRQAANQLDHETGLVRRCFTDQILAELVALREAIKSDYRDDWSVYHKWALLATLRDVATVRVGWPYQRPKISRQPRHKDAFNRFLQRTRFMAADIGQADNLQSQTCAPYIINNDACDPQAWRNLPAAGADGCISSPPYLNNFDYADASRLELYFWGEVTSWAQMCKVVRGKMLTSTTQQSSVKQADTAAQEILHLGSVGQEVTEIAERLSVQRLSRTRGKEYDRVIAPYFSAISNVLKNLAEHLKPNSPVVWLIGDSAPYGVYIDTPGLVTKIAATVGFTIEKDSVLRLRGQRWSTAGTRHNVRLSERLLLYRLS